MLGRLIVVFAFVVAAASWTGCGSLSAEESGQANAERTSGKDADSMHESPQLAANESPQTPIAPAVFVVDEGIEHSVLVASHIDRADAKNDSKLGSPDVTTSPIQQTSFEAD
jgi:hypothetical protein